jgi:hypothetical protein
MWKNGWNLLVDDPAVKLSARLGPSQTTCFSSTLISTLFLVLGVECVVDSSV